MQCRAMKKTENPVHVFASFEEEERILICAFTCSKKSIPGKSDHKMG
jgi:hypothetical protein